MGLLASVRAARRAVWGLDHRYRIPAAKRKNLRPNPHGRITA